MKLNGIEYTREEYFKHAGDEHQSFGIRAMEYRAGDEGLIKTYEVSTGGGLEFSIGENKGMDIYRMSYKGMNVGFMSKAGLHSAYNVNPESPAFRTTQGCGMLYTVGLTNAGGACSDELGSYCTHGNLKNSAASQITARGRWEDDEYFMEISGDLHESEFYGRNLYMRRKISTYAGAKSFTLEDRVENRAFIPDRVMLLYHINTGFPMLEEDVEFIAPETYAEGLTDRAKEMFALRSSAQAPIPMEEEHVYLMRLAKDAQGYSASTLWNNRLNLGIYIKFDATVLDKFVEWKCMRAGDYAMGMLPANCYPLGRDYANREGDGRVLQPFEHFTTHVEIGILDGAEEKDQFIAWLNTMK